MFVRLLACCLALFSISACNAEKPQEPAKDQGQRFDEVTAKLENAFSRLTVSEIADAPMEGMLEVTLTSGEIIYTTADGRYLFAGDVLEITDDGPVDVADRHFEEARKTGIANINPADLISFRAEEEQAELFVFTDVSCGYCRRLHQHMDDYNALGVTIHYLAFPRGGLTKESADTMRAIWCASDANAAMTTAKLTGDSAVPPKDCESPVDDQYSLGISFGVRGTPAVYTTDGKQLGGYVEPEDLRSLLKLE